MRDHVYIELKWKYRRKLQLKDVFNVSISSLRNLFSDKFPIWKEVVLILDDDDYGKVRLGSHFTFSFPLFSLPTNIRKKKKEEKAEREKLGEM